ncbi:hypothetical protein GL325_06430 [Aeromicrobium sp. 636]|uniref:Uncharacterized protein n=1 Tax=Aeromicrobium senzhongii TaxID=2663859 RepID=A0A8I0EUN8_9ACTN|nr:MULTISPECIES: hypothetical protein [Aeromicrobium]MBC9225948.1 hypothetical protein [Aeromicrobium senzhongii]MCQ3998055.1 hypothetical protein [Aeromicrobium sp. 636]
MTMLDLAVLTAQEIDPKGNQSIGWLPGLYVLGLCIIVGLLLWSFAKMAKKARQPWEGEGEDETPRKPEDDSTS